ncbi:MAG: hypothetical protein ABEJ78_05390 [Haloferacaceae archaeon]
MTVDTDAVGDTPLVELDVEVVMPDDAGVGKVDAIRAAGGSYYPNQYENPANPGIHAGTTSPEIWRQTDGNVTHFVAGACRRRRDSEKRDDIPRHVWRR